MLAGIQSQHKLNILHFLNGQVVAQLLPVAGGLGWVKNFSFQA
jgi:hypothetical protein